MYCLIDLICISANINEFWHPVICLLNLCMHVCISNCLIVWRFLEDDHYFPNYSPALSQSMLGLLFIYSLFLFFDLSVKNSNHFIKVLINPNFHLSCSLFWIVLFYLKTYCKNIFSVGFWWYIFWGNIHGLIFILLLYIFFHFYI